MMKLSCHGAAKQVTGSCYLIEVNDYRVLIDCGLFQGSRELEEDNAEDFGFDPASINVLLLTHAHLDHCGRIPLLVKRGFRGEIIATAPTRELARLILSDAANIQEEDSRRAQRQYARRNQSHDAPLYTVADAFHAMDYFSRSASYNEPIGVVPGIIATFIDAGHILGSASIVLALDDGKQRRKIVFSGDLGNPDRPVLRDPTYPPQVDYAVVETTYGDRAHRNVHDSVEELYQAITTTVERSGNVVIPTFALERAQEILFYLQDGIAQHRLPHNLTVFLDSPMAISATEIFRRYLNCFRDTFKQRIGNNDPFDLPNLHFTRDASESMAINQVSGGAVILAGSGMCTGGRIRHHLKHNLWRENSSIVFVGYAAEGTLARRIIDGAGVVKVFNEEIRVRATIWTINGFSAHAGQETLLDWIAHTGTPRKVFLTHGEPDRGMTALAGQLDQRHVAWQIPGMHEPIKLA